MPDRPHAAADAMLEMAADAPLVGLLSSLVTWIEDRLVEELHAAGFDDLRVSHNTVMALLPADGIRLTTLAERADMSKQAMGELVGDLERKGYVRREPDPADGRAKLIRWDARGERAHVAAMRAFATIDATLRDVIGTERMVDLRTSLATLARTVRQGPAEG